MLVLGVETSCDDTAAAVLRDGRTILANTVSSQDEVHGPYGGVVPELASRQHIQNILPIVDGALHKAGITLDELDGIAVTYGPGLVGSLLVGLSLVKGISFRTGIPYVGVNHLEAHLPAIPPEQEDPFSSTALLPSGGHPKGVRCPRARIGKSPYEFSFSGIKTAVWHYLKTQSHERWESRRADIAASFQEAVVDMLVNPTVKAAA